MSSTEENKKTTRRLVMDGINKGNWAVVDEIIAPNAVDHSLPPGMPNDRNGFKVFMTGFRAAFPDLTYTIDDEIAEGDKVYNRSMGTGTMKGDFQGMQASGKKATWQEMHVVRFDANGKVVEHWATVDQVSMLTQLGFMPGPGSH
jgi:predicted ester cyclase